MIKRKRKAFTIVELVIVIAIIAILAAILIPTFASIIDRANESSDIQAARQMNSALAEESVLAAPGNINQVILILKNRGYNTTEKLQPVSAGYSFYWYKTFNQILLVEEAEDDEDTARLVYPTDNDELSAAFEQAIGGENTIAGNHLEDGNYPETNVLFNLKTHTVGVLDLTDFEAALYSGGTITLTDDQIVEHSVIIDNKTILDLNGHTLTFAAGGAFIILDDLDIINGVSATDSGVYVSDAATGASETALSLAKALFVDPILKATNASIDLGTSAFFTGAVSKGSTSTLTGTTDSPRMPFILSGGTLTFGCDENTNLKVFLPGSQTTCITGSNNNNVVIKQCVFKNDADNEMSIDGDDIIINLAAEVTVPNITVSENKNMTISGSATAMLKTSGTLTVNGKLTINSGVTVDMSNTTIQIGQEADIKLIINGNIITNGSVGLLNTLIGSEKVTMSGSFNGMGVVKDENGATITLNGKELNLSELKSFTKLTIKGSGTITYPIAQLNRALGDSNLILDGCTFNGMTVTETDGGANITLNEKSLKLTELSFNGNLVILGAGTVDATGYEGGFSSLSISGNVAIKGSVETLNYFITSETVTIDNCRFAFGENSVILSRSGKSTSIKLDSDTVISGINVPKDYTVEIKKAEGVSDAPTLTMTSYSAIGSVTVYGVTVNTVGTSPIEFIIGKVWTENDNVKYDVSCTFANEDISAKVVGDGITATVLKNDANLGSFEIAKGKEVIIKSNGDTKHTVTSVSITNNGTLNLEKVTIAASNIPSGTVKLTDVTVNTDGPSPIAYIINTPSTWTITRCKFSDTDYGSITCTVDTNGITLTNDSSIEGGASIPGDITINLGGKNLSLGNFTITGTLKITGSGAILGDVDALNKLINGNVTIAGCTFSYTIGGTTYSITLAKANADTTTITLGGESVNLGGLEVPANTTVNISASSGKPVITGSITVAATGALKLKNVTIADATVVGSLNSILNSGNVTLDNCTICGVIVTEDTDNKTVYITLDGDATLGGLEINCNVIIDLGNNTLTVNGSGITVTANGVLTVEGGGKITTSNLATAIFTVNSGAKLYLGTDDSVIEITVPTGYSMGIDLKAGGTAIIGKNCSFVNGTETVQISIDEQGNVTATLLTSVKLSNEVTITENVTIKLGEYTLTLESGASFNISGGKLTIQGAGQIIGSIGQLNSLINTADITVTSCDYAIGNESNVITLNKTNDAVNITLGSSTTTLTGLNVSKATTIALNNCTLTLGNNYSGITLAGTGSISDHVKVLNSIIAGTGPALASGCTFNGITVTTGTDGIIMNISDDADISGLSIPDTKKVTISTTGNNALTINKLITVDGTLTISGVTIQSDAKEAFIVNGTLNISNSSIVMDKITITDSGEVNLNTVTIGGDIDELNSFLSDDDITLTNCTICDVTVTENENGTVSITLDGDAYLSGLNVTKPITISGEGTLTLNSLGTISGSLAINSGVAVTSELLYTFLNNANLTLNGCTINNMTVNEGENGTTIDLKNQSLALDGITFTGELTISNGTVTGTLSKIVSNGNLTLENCKYGDFTITKNSTNGTTLSGGTIAVDNIPTGGSLTLSGVEITGDLGNILSNGNLTLENCKYGTSTITKNSTNGTTLSGGTIAVDNIPTGGSLTLSGVEITGDLGNILSNGNLTLKDECKYGTSTINKNSSGTTLSGGTIAVDEIPENGRLTLSGVEITGDLGNPLEYLVGKIGGNAIFTNCTFGTIVATVNANGITLTGDSSIEEAYTVSGKTVTINLGGKKLTLNNVITVNGTTLNIKGTGTIEAEVVYALTVNSGATLNIGDSNTSTITVDATAALFTGGEEYGEYAPISNKGTLNLTNTDVDSSGSCIYVESESESETAYTTIIGGILKHGSGAKCGHLYTSKAKDFLGMYSWNGSPDRLTCVFKGLTLGDLIGGIQVNEDIAIDEDITLEQKASLVIDSSGKVTLNSTITIGEGGSFTIASVDGFGQIVARENGKIVVNGGTLVIDKSFYDSLVSQEAIDLTEGKIHVTDNENTIEAIVKGKEISLGDYSSTTTSLTVEGGTLTVPSSFESLPKNLTLTLNNTTLDECNSAFVNSIISNGNINIDGTCSIPNTVTNSNGDVVAVGVEVTKDATDGTTIKITDSAVNGNPFTGINTLVIGEGDKVTIVVPAGDYFHVTNKMFTIHGTLKITGSGQIVAGYHDFYTLVDNGTLEISGTSEGQKLTTESGTAVNAKTILRNLVADASGKITVKNFSTNNANVTKDATGTTLDLIGSFNFGATTTINNNVTVNLGGNSFSVSTGMISIQNGGKLTVNGTGEVYINSKTNGAITVGSSSFLDLNNVTITAVNGSNSLLYLINNSGTVTITGGSYEIEYNAGATYQNGQIYNNGGKLEFVTWKSMFDTRNVVNNGGTVICNKTTYGTIPAPTIKDTEINTYTAAYGWKYAVAYIRDVALTSGMNYENCTFYDSSTSITCDIIDGVVKNAEATYTSIYDYPLYFVINEWLGISCETLKVVDGSGHTLTCTISNGIITIIDQSVYVGYDAPIAYITQNLIGKVNATNCTFIGEYGHTLTCTINNGVITNLTVYIGSDEPIEYITKNLIEKVNTDCTFVNDDGKTLLSCNIDGSKSTITLLSDYPYDDWIYIYSDITIILSGHSFSAIFCFPNNDTLTVTGTGEFECKGIYDSNYAYNAELVKDYSTDPS